MPPTRIIPLALNANCATQLVILSSPYKTDQLEKVTREQIVALIKKGNLLFANQGKISLPIVDRMYRKMQIGINFPDIKICGGMICDGHHRYIAALLAGIDIQICPGNISQINLTPWEAVTIEEADWDTPEQVAAHNRKDAEYNRKTMEEIEALLNKT